MENCCNYYAAVWQLSLFCRFYGRAIPVGEKNGVFVKFHTYTRNEDIDDLYVEFNNNIEPMSFMDLVADSSHLYVIGHGDAEEDYGGSVFYDKYTLFTEEQIKEMYERKAIHFKYGSSLESLIEQGQAIIYNKEEYSLE